MTLDSEKSLPRLFIWTYVGCCRCVGRSALGREEEARDQCDPIYECFCATASAEHGRLFSQICSLIRHVSARWPTITTDFWMKLAHTFSRTIIRTSRFWLYLLGFYSQRHELYRKKDKQMNIDKHENFNGMRRIKMNVLDQKIDFAFVFTVRNANPNGDPLKRKPASSKL